jgi:hypothetical protein
MSQGTPLDLDDAITKARGGRGQAWQYTATLARLVIRVWFEEAPAAGLYFVCGQCRRMQLSAHWQPVRLVVSPPDAERETWLLTDGDDCRVECGLVFAVRSDEFLQL